MPKSPRHIEKDKPRREALRDNYYYDSKEQFEDISSYSSDERRRSDQRDIRRGRAGVSSGRGRAVRRGGKRGSAAGKIAAVLVVLLVLGAGLFVYMFMGLKVTELSGDLAAGAGKAGVKNIALFGLDSRDETNKGRSDMLMILSVNSNDKTMRMASIMRDSYVYIDGYGYDKLCHAYAYGGAELAVRTLNQNFGLDIEDYATVNFYKMAEIVDAFGGVELELSPEEMREVNQNLFDLTRELEKEGRSAPIKASDYFTALDGTHNMIDTEYSGGKVKLSGVQAVAYARIRHLDGDEYRAGRQQQVLMGLVKQANPLKYPFIAHGVLPHCETSMGVGELCGLLPFAIGGFDIQTHTFPSEEEGAYGDTVGDMWIYCFDESLMREHLQTFLYG